MEHVRNEYFLLKSLVVEKSADQVRANCVSGCVRSRSESPWFSGFRKNSSGWKRLPTMRFFVLMNCLESLLLLQTSITSETWLIQSSCAEVALVFLCQVVPRTFSIFFLVKVCKLSLKSQSCNSQRKTTDSGEGWIIVLFQLEASVRHKTSLFFKRELVFN